MRSPATSPAHSIAFALDGAIRHVGIRPALTRGHVLKGQIRRDIAIFLLVGRASVPAGVAKRGLAFRAALRIRRCGRGRAEGGHATPF